MPPSYRHWKCHTQWPRKGRRNQSVPKEGKAFLTSSTIPGNYDPHTGSQHSILWHHTMLVFYTWHDHTYSPQVDITSYVYIWTSNKHNIMWILSCCKHEPPLFLIAVCTLDVRALSLVSVCSSSLSNSSNILKVQNKSVCKHAEYTDEEALSCCSAVNTTPHAWCKASDYYNMYRVCSGLTFAGRLAHPQWSLLSFWVCGRWLLLAPTACPAGW